MQSFERNAIPDLGTNEDSQAQIATRNGSFRATAGHWFRARPGFEWVLVICLTLAAITFAAYSLKLLYDGHHSVTRQDYWRIYQLDLRLPFPSNALYKHNDHPIFFPSLIWLPILHFFHNNQTLLFFCGTVITLSTLLVFLFALLRSPELPRVPRCAMALLFTVACLWVAKANILTSGGFSCMNSLTTSSVMAGLLGLDLLRRRQLRLMVIALVGVIVSGTIATFSFATGLACWFAFVVVALVCRLGWRVPTLIGISGALMSGVFLILPNDGISEVGRGLSHVALEPSALLLRFVQLLGAPWIYYGLGFPLPETSNVYVAAAAFGAIGLFFAAYFLFERYRAGRPVITLDVVALGLMVFVLGSLGLITLGRGNLMANSAPEVFALRYCYWSPFFWVTLFVAALSRWPRLCRSPFLLATAALALTAGALPSGARVARSYIHGRKSSEEAALRLICGVEDRSSLKSLFVSEVPDKLIYPLTRQYRAKGLDMFAWPGASLVGQSLPVSTQTNSSSNAAVMGNWWLERIIPTTTKSPGARFSGWCIPSEPHLRANFVTISDETRRVVGLGRFTIPRPDYNRTYQIPSRHVVGFRGYIKNYSSKRRYECHPAIEGELVSTTLKRLGPLLQAD